MTDNEKTIRDFIATWSGLNVDEIVSYFTEDGVYHNMPTKPVAGRANLRSFIAAFLKDWSRTDWQILNIMSNGDVVIAERLDRTVAKGRTVDLPCCGVFEMAGGKIKVWRDYFDMATYTRALS